jgi:hypothetical protein
MSRDLNFDVYCHGADNLPTNYILRVVWMKMSSDRNRYIILSSVR